jgi:hypothetical protein
LPRKAELDGLLTYVGMHVNPEIADVFGLRIMALGLAVTAAGFVLARGGKK